MTLEKLLFYYLLAINLVGFAIMGIDKYKARHNRWRIPERTLMLTAFLGGALGVWAGMTVFRHKTKHNLFVWGVPILLVLQIAALLYFGVIRR